MENITVLFAGFELNSAFNNSLSKSFNGKSSVELSIDWALRNGKKTFILSIPKNASVFSEFLSSNDELKIIEEDSWDASKIAKKISECCKEVDCSTASYAWIDLPFLSDDLTKKLLQMHIENLSEYSFADGFPYGVCPEIIDCGCAAIISELSKDKLVLPTRTAIFDVIKGDINSFEIETLVSDIDYRPLRISLECSTKAGFISSLELFNSLENVDISVENLCKNASENPKVLRNIPHFFDIQITSKINNKTLYSPENANIGIESLCDMDIEKFNSLVKKISRFNPNAVISLSCFGEPLLHPDFTKFVELVTKKDLKIVIETDGLGISENLVEEIAKIPNIDGKIDFIIQLDAFDYEFYSKVRNASESDFEKAVNSVSILSKKFENHVYPQMTRMNENEENLEKFFRFWKNSESPSKGKLIIKKYDSLCKKLVERKPADLSPLVRIPCWHLCRDFVILSDGSVPKCRSCGKNEILGNAFEEDLENLWEKGFSYYSNHVSLRYEENCGVCDEYYTFNF